MNEPARTGPTGRRRLVAGLLGALLTGAVLSGCVVNTESTVPPGDPVGTDRVDAIADQLPATVAATGELKVGVNVPYAPNEFKDDDGRIVGFAVELVEALGDVLGVRPVFNESDFDRIIPAVQAGTFDMGSSSFTDTKEREQSVDFVTYYSAGVQWAQRVGDDVDPDNACGLRVAVQTTTYEDIDEVPAKSEACVAAGRPPIDKVKYDSQDEATNALILGRVDALSADSPITAYAIARSDGRLETAGPVFDAAPYGFVVAKGSPLGPVLQQAMQHLIDSGVYAQIAQRWGMEEGTIDTAQINAATS
ncbi:ABC transporter substrate-binding protein [Rhodococcus rhodochrous KG-21]|uniref:ABC transporter substrate-binding protein n=1 Tax=Rhodococcus rhodochrous KG-21 TaxID=1441923 RepID=A0A0M8PCQ8_RHORH|nr:ABC transporter substrate-binding protein [Rhodococcus rhodochrous]KOS53736.1 ABC transporter substrate-binding protein [Rhodococcus rhodochrous KG-21]